MNHMSKPLLSFAPLNKSQKELLINWLSQGHIREWLHGEGLQNTLQDIDRFFQGSSYAQHWIAYHEGVPFGYLITSEVQKGEDSSDDYAPFCQEEGRAITLDLFICDINFLGQGLAVPMIQEFLLSQFSDVAEVFIDPEASNRREPCCACLSNSRRCSRCSDVL